MFAAAPGFQRARFGTRVTGGEIAGHRPSGDVQAGRYRPLSRCQPGAQDLRDRIAGRPLLSRGRHDATVSSAMMAAGTASLSPGGMAR